MKICRVNDAGQMQAADLEDGTAIIGVGATLGSDGKGHLPIEAVDYDAKLFWRGPPSGTRASLGIAHPFPEKWIDARDCEALDWKDAK
jgi:hypothetical protein